MEYTLGDSWENVDHWINTVILMGVSEFQYFGSIGHEFSVEEFVHQIHLDYNVDEAQELTTPITNGVEFVTLKIIIFIINLYKYYILNKSLYTYFNMFCYVI